MKNIDMLNQYAGDDMNAEDTALQMTLVEAVEECSDGEYTMSEDDTKKFIALYHEKVKWLDAEKEI